LRIKIASPGVRLLEQADKSKLERVDMSLVEAFENKLDRVVKNLRMGLGLSY